MSDAGAGSGEKTFDPTEKRLSDARQKGNIVKSADITAAAGYAGLLSALTLFGPGIVKSLGAGMAEFFSRADSFSATVTGPGGATFLVYLLAQFCLHILPVFALPMLFILASLWAQNAFTFSGDKVIPKLSRISPISNATNRFGASGLFEFFKSFAKLIVVSVAVVLFLKQNFAEITGSSTIQVQTLAWLMASYLINLFIVVFLIAAVTGVFDYLWQAFDHKRKLMMSRQEILDESKQSEGDPHLKQRRRQRGYDIATQRMMAAIPTADVVIVNPTHFAVALSWDQTKASAPICVAKGVDEVAASIREAATTAAVPIHRDPATARAIFATVEIGQEVLPDHYKPVAAAIRYAEKIRQMAQRKDGWK